MPVPLPPAPASIALPAPPQDPPTLEDVIAAKYYHAHVELAVALQDPGAPTDADVAAAELYKSNIIMAHDAGGQGVPPWFEPTMAPILAPIHTLVGQIRNHQLLDGSITPFVILPFNDGTMPPQNLPALINVASIRALNAAQTLAYAAGYGLGNIPTVRARRVAIGRHIGCSAIV